jgi:hypothetical protein
MLLALALLYDTPLVVSVRPREMARKKYQQRTGLRPYRVAAYPI